MNRLKTVVVANGPLTWTPDLVALVAEADLVMAADGGANHLARIGVRPAAVLGDLDSIEDDVRTWIGDDRLIHRGDQEHTDLDKCLNHVDELGAESVTVLAALGGRIDHEIGNLGLLAARASGRRLVFLDSHGLTMAVHGTAKLEAESGETWSFWTFDPAVLVTLAGVEWPVERRALAVQQRPSISNRAVADVVHITSEGGSVIVNRWFHNEKTRP